MKQTFIVRQNASGTEKDRPNASSKQTGTWSGVQPPSQVYPRGLGGFATTDLNTSNFSFSCDICWPMRLVIAWFSRVNRFV